MIDRLVHHAEVISLKGDSYRLKDRGLGRVPAATKTNDRRSTTNPREFHFLRRQGVGRWLRYEACLLDVGICRCPSRGSRGGTMHVQRALLPDTRREPWTVTADKPSPAVP